MRADNVAAMARIAEALELTGASFDHHTRLVTIGPMVWRTAGWAWSRSMRMQPALC